MRIAQRLQEQRDGAGGRMRHQSQAEARRVQIGLVAGGDHVAKPDILLKGERGQEMRRGAALRDDADPGGLARRADRRGPDMGAIGEIDVAEAVRAEQPNAERFRQGGQFRLEPFALRPGLSEAGGEHHRRAPAGSGQIAQRVCCGGERHQDDTQINRLADRRRAGDGAAAMHDAAIAVDQMQSPLKPAASQIVERGHRPARPVRRAEQPDRARAQQGLMRGCLGVHCRVLPLRCARRAGRRRRYR